MVPLKRLIRCVRVDTENDQCHRRRAAFRTSTWSVLSFCSFLSGSSILAACSGVSVLSVGSALSVLSIGSTLSVLSIGSVDSYLSIGSHGCTMRLFSDCTDRAWNGNISLDIYFEDETWDNMSRCTFYDYQRYKKYETNNNDCAYRPARCVFENFGDGTPLKNVSCKARRKGFSTFRDMGDRPSFKVKFYDENDDKLDLHMGSVGYVPDLVADKCTFNNMLYSSSYTGHTEVEAYRTYYDRLKYPATPTADYVRISTYRGTHLRDRYVGSIVEDVNNDDYVTRVSEYGSDWLLMEVDNTGMEYKGAKGTYKDSIPRKLFEKLINREEKEDEADGGLLHLMNITEVVMFYNGELMTHNWDGASLRPIPNNFYIILWGNDTDPRARFLPKGMDWVFQGCVYDFFTDRGSPFAGPVQAARAVLLGNGSHASRLEMQMETYEKYRSMTCGEEVGQMLLVFLLSAASVTGICGLLYLLVRAIRKIVVVHVTPRC